jgi:TRAP-type C4-dicarboxylate transport system permease small subunit
MSGRADATVRRAEALAYALAVASAACLLAMSLATAADVAMRLILNSPVEGLYDIQQMLLLFVIGACFPLASIRGQHISVDFVVNVLPPRLRALFDVAGTLLLIAALALFAWQLGRYAADQWAFPVTSQHLGWPLHVWWTLCAGAVALAVPAEALRLWARLAAPPA